MFKKLLWFGLLLCGVLSTTAATVKADICDTQVSSGPALSPSDPLLTAAYSWLQWLNNGGGYTCSKVSSTHVQCTRSGQPIYHTYLYCNTTTCWADHYAGSTWRNESSWTKGSSVTYIDHEDPHYANLYTAVNVCWPAGSCPDTYYVCFH